PNDHPLRLNLRRQGSERTRHPVLHQHLGGVDVRADPESDRERIAAVRSAVGLHVDHTVNAVHLLLDWQGYSIDQVAGAGPWIARRHLDRGGHHVWILRHREREQGDAADHNHEDRQYVRQNRTFNEELRNHGCHYLGVASVVLASEVRTSGLTFWPGIASWMPAMTTRSAGARPSSTMRI